MPLIKCSNANAVVRDAVVLDLGDLGREAERIIADARGSADEIERIARHQATALTAGAAEEGRAAGHAEGLQKGLEQGRAEGHAEALEQSADALAQLTSAWSAALDDWQAERRAMYLAARDDVLEMAIAIAQRIVQREIEHHPEIVRDQIAAALEFVRGPTAVAIELNPLDRPLIEDALPALLEAASTCEDATIVESPTIERGGCRIRTRGGTIDATIQTQLDRIVEALLPAARGRFNQASENIGGAIADPRDPEIEGGASC